MNAPYTTVFEITQKGFDWWFPAAGVPFLLVGAVLIWVGRSKKWTGFRSSIAYFYLGFASLWTLIVFGTMFSEYSNLHWAYKNGRYSVVEGTVQNFRPMPYQGHRDECFSVRDATFCYSDYGPTAGFNNSMSHGGPIRSGLSVRIAYVDNHILRIDVRQDQVPSSAERGATKEAAQARWRAREERDFRLDKMNLAFAFAAVFMTAWWNLSWQRFMKFWVKPPNRRITIIGFRVFFAANLVAAIWYLISQILGHSRPLRAYVDATEMSAIWILVVILMVYFAEWQTRKRDKRKEVPTVS